MGRIKRGGGDGGEPVRSPLGWSTDQLRARLPRSAGRVKGPSPYDHGS